MGDSSPSPLMELKDSTLPPLCPTSLKAVQWSGASHQRLDLPPLPLHHPIAALSWLTRAASSFHSKPVLGDELETRGLRRCQTHDLLRLLGVVLGWQALTLLMELLRQGGGCQGLLNVTWLMCCRGSSKTPLRGPFWWYSYPKAPPQILPILWQDLFNPR